MADKLHVDNNLAGAVQGFLVVVNPNAGIGKGGRDWGQISALLDRHEIHYQAVFTEGPGHGVRLVAEGVKAGYRHILAVGGDGTMNEIVNGVFAQQECPGTDLSIGMIAVGTGNDWIRSYGIPMNYQEAIPILKNRHTMLQDVGIVHYHVGKVSHSRYFVNMAGLGFDGLVAKRTNDDKARGKGNPLLYLKHLLASLFAYTSCQARIQVDGKEIREKLFSLGIGIGQYNGGGMRQAPDAKTDDGLFDLTLIKDLSKWSVISNVRRLYNGTIKQHKRVDSLVGKLIRIDCDQPVLLEADGESLGHTPLAFDILPRSIRVIVPPQQTQ